MSAVVERRRSLAELYRRMREAIEHIEARIPAATEVAGRFSESDVSPSGEVLPAAPDREVFAKLEAVDGLLHEVLSFEVSVPSGEAAASAEGVSSPAVEAGDEIADLYRRIREAGRDGDKSEARRLFGRLRQLQRREAAELEKVYDRVLGATLSRGDELIRRADELLERHAAPATGRPST